MELTIKQREHCSRMNVPFLGVELVGEHYGKKRLTDEQVKALCHHYFGSEQSKRFLIMDFLGLKFNLSEDFPPEYVDVEKVERDMGLNGQLQMFEDPDCRMVYGFRNLHFVGL